MRWTMVAQKRNPRSDFDMEFENYMTSLDEFVSTVFMYWSGVVWPRSRNMGLIDMGSLNVNSKSLDMVLVGEFFRWNKNEFARTLNCGGVIRAISPYPRVFDMTLYGPPVHRFFYIQEDTDIFKKPKIVLDVTVSTRFLSDESAVELYHVWRYNGHLPDRASLTTHVSWKSNRLETVTF